MRMCKIRLEIEQILSVDAAQWGFYCIQDPCNLSEMRTESGLHPWWQRTITPLMLGNWGDSLRISF